MVHQFIKVNVKVATFLGLATQRSQFPDGHYLLWKLDLIPLGGNSDDTLRMIGGVGMTSIEARKEQKGETRTPLPIAEDVRFRIEDSEESSAGNLQGTDDGDSSLLNGEDPQEGAEDTGTYGEDVEQDNNGEGVEDE